MWKYYSLKYFLSTLRLTYLVDRVEPRDVAEAVVVVPAVEMLGVEPREASGAAVEGQGAVGIEPTLAHLSMGVEPKDDAGATVGGRPEAVGVKPTLGPVVEVFLFGIVKVNFFPFGCLAFLFAPQLLGSLTTFFPTSLNLTSRALYTVSTSTGTPPLPVGGQLEEVLQCWQQ